MDEMATRGKTIAQTPDGITQSNLVTLVSLFQKECLVPCMCKCHPPSLQELSPLLFIEMKHDQSSNSISGK